MKKHFYISMFLFFCASAAFAGVEPPTSSLQPPAIADPAVRIVAIAGMVASAVQGVKRIFPRIGGPSAIALAIVGAVAATYAAAPPGAELLTWNFLWQAALAAFTAHGAHALTTRRT